MTCVFREYKIKTKMVHEQWPQLKMLFFCFCFFWGVGGVILFFSGAELTFSGGEIKIWYVGSLLGGLVTGVEGGLPPSHQ